VTLLSRELSKLTVHEQEQILLDLHGLNTSCCSILHNDDVTYDGITSTSKSPSLEKNSDSFVLQRLRNELETVVKNSESQDISNAFLEAKRQDADYILRDDDFLRLFLYPHIHSGIHHYDRAVQMILRHFQIKQKLFGNKLLTKDVRQADLSALDMEILNRGMIQILPQRDESERDVMMSIFLPLGEAQTISFYRVTFYLLMSHMKRQIQQRQAPRDVIWITCSVADFEKELLLLEQLHSNVSKGVPQRVVGGHFCGFCPDLERIGAKYQLRLNRSPELKTFHGQEFRKRYHGGISWHDIYSSLADYGINADPLTNFPMQPDGTCSTTNHGILLQVIKEWEERVYGPVEKDGRDGDHACIMPQPFDVLLGKTKRSLNHSGNRRLATLCALHYDTYNNTNSKHRKTELSDRIVSMIHESGGQFLAWKQSKESASLSGADVGTWISADWLTARNKVAHVFRHLRAKKNNAK
jgi:hypothetical protein